MAVTASAARRLTRRRFLAGAGAVLGSATTGIAKPYLSFAADRPLITHGVQSGDVSSDSAVVWARADRPSRMFVEFATTESFRNAEALAPVDALSESDCTAKLLLEELPPGQDIFYRIRFQALSAPNALSEPLIGRFRTPPQEGRPVSFVWSGDVAGQGWGIDDAHGGMRTFATMRKNRPDFFIHCGDSVYADCPIESEVKLPGGELWRNIVTEEKSKVAETLADYRGNYKYNLLDRNVRAFNAEVPILAVWDDHEVIDNWWPDRLLTDKASGEKSLLALSARARRAFHEFMPTRETLRERGRLYRRLSYGPLLDVFMVDLRSYRGPVQGRNSPAYGPDSYLLAPTQIAWLKRALVSSRATWKVIVSSLPLALLTDDGIAQGDGPPLGRELELADLLAFIQRAGVRNTVWLTADMHYTAAHYYDPNRAQFQDFEPFWEFVSGPLHAGTWSPGKLDDTFGPRVVFAKGCTPEQGDNLAPCFGLQFFGHVAIDDRTEVMTVSLKDVEDRVLWATDIEPSPEGCRACGHDART
ncbi:MAG: alkaline phosphatase D family protein [Bradyrhizobiaceae bacterium]|nr:alkaline phosphatase D family protein [Bradyrhizobiaceae bacterium]